MKWFISACLTFLAVGFAAGCIFLDYIYQKCTGKSEQSYDYWEDGNDEGSA